MSKLKEYRLVEIAKSQTGPFGSQLHESDYVEKGTPIVTVEHLGIEEFSLANLPLVCDEDKERLSKYILKEGDIVFSRVGSIDRCTYVSKEEDGWMFSGRCIRVRTNKKANSRYLNFYFRQSYFKKMMLNISVGATMPSLNTSLMDGIKLFLPELETQNEIASLLSVIDNRIKLNNRINRELEQIAKLIYDYWFLQFDYPDKNGKPYKSNGGKMVYNKKLRREIPEGWGVEVLTERITEIKSGDWGKESKQGKYTEKVNCIRGADLNGFNGLEQCNPPTRFIHQNNLSKILQEEDIVIEISGGSPTQSTGRLSFVTESSMKRFDNPLICSNFCKPITLKNKELVCVFVYEWNKLYENNIFFNYEGKTSGIKNLLFDVFAKSYKTVIPDENVVKKFNKIVESIHKKKHANLTENHRLAELRDWLLPMLMNGQVTVKATEEKTNKLSAAAEPESKYNGN